MCKKIVGAMECVGGGVRGGWVAGGSKGWSIWIGPVNPRESRG